MSTSTKLANHRRRDQRRKYWDGTGKRVFIVKKPMSLIRVFCFFLSFGSVAVASVQYAENPRKCRFWSQNRKQSLAQCEEGFCSGRGVTRVRSWQSRLSFPQKIQVCRFSCLLVGKTVSSRFYRHSFALVAIGLVTSHPELEAGRWGGFKQAKLPRGLAINARRSLRIAFSTQLRYKHNQLEIMCYRLSPSRLDRLLPVTSYACNLAPLGFDPEPN